MPIHLSYHFQVQFSLSLLVFFSITPLSTLTHCIVKELPLDSSAIHH